MERGPSNSNGSGGMVNLASSVKSEMTRTEIALLDCVDEPIDDLRFVWGSRKGHAIWTCRGLKSGAGPLECAVYGGRCGIEHFGNLRGRKAKDVAQDQSCSLLGRQMLETGDERESDGLSGVVTSLGPGFEFIDQSVGIWFEPPRFV